MSPVPVVPLGLRISSHGVIHVVVGDGGFHALCGARLRRLRTSTSSRRGALTPRLHLYGRRSSFDTLCCRRCRRFERRVKRQYPLGKRQVQVGREPRRSHA